MLSRFPASGILAIHWRIWDLTFQLFSDLQHLVQVAGERKAVLQ